MSRHLFIVGAQRSASTYLYYLLDEHPSVEMARPVVPEPKFFMQEDSENRLEEYRVRFFPEGASICGEKSTSYFETEAAAKRIAKLFPDALIVVTLRNPVHRAISNYWFSVSHRIEKEPITVLVDEKAQDRTFEKTSVSPYGYLRRGTYIDCLDMYARYFPLEQMRILVQEDFVGNLTAVQDFYESIGIARDFSPDSLDETINDGSYSASSTPAEVVDFLYSYYEERNRKLAHKYELNLDSWNRIGPIGTFNSESADRESLSTSWK